MIKRTSLANWQGAWFSDDLQYRFLLWRRWNPDALTTSWCNFIMLNPSTADELTNDPTVERCQKRAMQWGYGGLYVTNLFGLRATDPKELTQRAEPIGRPDNDTMILETAKLSKLPGFIRRSETVYNSPALFPGVDSLRCLINYRLLVMNARTRGTMQALEPQH